MTSDQFKSALDALGWSQIYFAELVDRHPNRISDWATGKVVVPRWAELLLTIAQRTRSFNEELFSLDK